MKKLLSWLKARFMPRGHAYWVVAWRDKEGAVYEEKSSGLSSYLFLTRREAERFAERMREETETIEVLGVARVGLPWQMTVARYEELAEGKFHVHFDEV